MFFMQMNAQSQDLIFIKNDTIDAKIIEIGLENLVYQEADMPIKVINKNKVLRIEYKNGIVEDFGSTNPRKINPYNIGLVFATLPDDYDMIKIDAEFNYFVKPFITISCNAGFDFEQNLYYSVGPRYYINTTHSKIRFTPFLGFQIGKINYSNNYGYYSSDLLHFEPKSITFEFPIGFEYITRDGFNFGARFNPMLLGKIPDVFYLFSIKFGRSF